MTIASTTELICFLVLSVTLVAGSLGVVLLPNIVYSAFLLGGVLNKKETMAAIPGLLLRRVLSGAVCAGLFALLLRASFTTDWALPGPTPVGEEATIRIGEHLFSDYLLPFELASVLLLMAMIGAIVLARRDVFSSDVITGEPVDQGLIEKARTPLLLEKPALEKTS
jgi:NAD(P)H-quinone oxidoreductase subunit 6